MTSTVLSLDIESTGTNPATDRIIQIAIVSEERYVDWVCNPGIPIPAESSAVHGFTNEMVEKLPYFKCFASEIHALVKDADLVGFNLSNFDVPLLWEEFHRVGIEWDLSDTKIFDAGTLFKRREERTLSAAVKFYLGHELPGAHNALIDADATLDVWKEQLRRYGLEDATRDELARASSYEEVRVDLAGKLVVGKDGRPAYNFGKSKGVAVVDDPGFGKWMLDKDFTANTKMHLDRILYGDRADESVEYGIPF